MATRGNWVRVTKPFPSNMDDWPQALHDASGTQMSLDDCVGPVSGVRWINGYDWDQWGSGTRRSLAADGRFFQIHEREPVTFLAADQRAGVRGRTWPQLVAHDAFNGVELWHRSMGGTLKPGMIFADGLLYVVGLNGQPDDKLCALDPATGIAVRVLKDIKLPVGHGHDVQHGGFNEQNPSLADMTMMRYADGVLVFPTDDNGCTAWDLKSQKLLWKQAGPPYLNWLGTTGMWVGHDADETVLVVGQNAWVISADAQKLLCRDLHTGAVCWEAALKSAAERLYFATGGIVFTREKAPRGGDAKHPRVNANGEIHTLRAWQGDTGNFLWQFNYQGEGINQQQGSDEVCVFGSEVWVLAHRPGPMFAVLDLTTGQEKKAITPASQFSLNGGHCFPPSFTRNWIISWGPCFFNPHTGQTYQNLGSMRPSCGTGALYANGLSYQSMSSCRCERVIRGGVVAYSSDPLPSPPTDTQRLEKGAAFDRTISAKAAASDWPMYRHDPSRSGSTPSDVDATPRILWTATLEGRPTQPVSAGGKVFCSVSDQHVVCALDGQTGKLLWQYRIGARVDSSPTWQDGRVFFGGCDGWVYCLAADDGQLIWRFMAAQGERRIMVREQLESLWPVHGSLIVDHDRVYVEAGRQTQLDGGLSFYALEPATGKILWSSHLTGQGGETVSDLMSSDGNQLFIVNDFSESYRCTQIDPHSGAVQRQSLKDKKNPHAQGAIGMIWSGMMGFLCQRVYGNITGVGTEGRRYWYYPKLGDTLGDLLCADGPRVWGFLHYPDGGERGNWVFCNGGATPWKQKLEPNAAGMKTANEKALLHTGDKLLIASQPDDKLDTGTVTVFDADTGKTLGEISTPGAPCFDGLSAAAGRLFLSSENAKLTCFGE